VLDLHGRVALITGGGTGMGRAIGTALASQGASVAISYAHSRDDAEATSEQLRSLGVRSAAFRADVRQVAECDGLVEAVIEDFGRLDILVGCAGTTRHIPFPDLAGVTEEAWDDVFDTNLKGAFFVTRAAAIWMREHGDGRSVIVNITSTAAFGTTGSSIPYSVSKGALVQTTKLLAVALAPKIRVNSVAPGLVLTRWWTQLGDEVVQQRIASTRFQRPTELDDVVQVAMVAITNESISGQTLLVDPANIMP
jgi:3-oxoacyl-[acyl-carrier protein] reductase